MKGADWIQLSMAIVAFLGFILALMNQFTLKKQTNIHYKEWKYSVKPVFKITKVYHLNHLYEWTLFFENTNNVYHQIHKVSFSSDKVEISKIAMHGELRQQYKDYEDVFKDNVIIMRPLTDEFIVGRVKIEGIDLVGNPFEAISPDIKFTNKYIENTIDLTQKYLKILK